MELPFSESAFLDVFGAYNQRWWPVVLTLWVVTLIIAARLWRRQSSGRVVMVLLAAHWLWSGVAYHWLHFRSINPAAAVFAAGFGMQGTLFAWMALTAKGYFAFDRTIRGLIAATFVGYGLFYPFLGLALGLDYPRLPLFAVPCPTTLITVGVLLGSSGLPRVVNLLPIIWAVIGSSAAVVLGIRADLALIAAAVFLVVDTLVPRALGPRV